MADKQDIPVILYEKDQEIPTTKSCQFVAVYQDNLLPGHYLKIQGNRISADENSSANLKYTLFNDSSDGQLIILSDSTGQYSLAYENRKNSKPVIFVKRTNVTKTTSIQTAKDKGIVFVMTTISSCGRVTKVCLQPWSSTKNHDMHFLAFDDNGQVMDPSSNGLGKNMPRCQFNFWEI